MAFTRQDSGREPDRLGEITGKISECGKKNIAETVTAKPPASRKSVLKEFLYQQRVLC
jgi:hypothetical protein